MREQEREREREQESERESERVGNAETDKLEEEVYLLIQKY